MLACRVTTVRKVTEGGLPVARSVARFDSRGPELAPLVAAAHERERAAAAVHGY